MSPFISDFIDTEKAIIGEKVHSLLRVNVRTLISKDVDCELQLALVVK